MCVCVCVCVCVCERVSKIHVTIKKKLLWKCSSNTSTKYKESSFQCVNPPVIYRTIS